MSSLGAVIVGGAVHPALWASRVSEGTPVGTCRCGGPMIGSAPRRWNGTRWYEAACAACGAEVTAPNGKLAQKRALDLVA